MDCRIVRPTGNVDLPGRQQELATAVPCLNLAAAPASLSAMTATTHVVPIAATGFDSSLAPTTTSRFAAPAGDQARAQARLADGMVADGGRCSRRRFLGATAALLGAYRLPAGSADAAAAAPASAPASASHPSPEEEGRQLAADLRRSPPALSTAGTLRRRDSGGRWLQALPVQLEVRGNDAEWESFYRVFAPSGALLETLSVSHHASQRSQYRFRRPGEPNPGAADAVLEGNATAVPFAGSDFWLCDLGLEFLHWPGQRIVRTEMRKGRSCRVLESLNPDPVPGAYARVLSWVDLENGGLLRAGAFDPDGRPRKEFNIGSVRKINGRFQLKSMEIRDARTDTRTRLEFELEIGDDQ